MKLNNFLWIVLLNFCCTFASDPKPREPRVRKRVRFAYEAATPAASISSNPVVPSGFSLPDGRPAAFASVFTFIDGATFADPSLEIVQLDLVNLDGKLALLAGCIVAEPYNSMPARKKSGSFELYDYKQSLCSLIQTSGFPEPLPASPRSFIRNLIKENQELAKKSGDLQVENSVLKFDNQYLRDDNRHLRSMQ